MGKPLDLDSSPSREQGNSRASSRRCTSHEENKRSQEEEAGGGMKLKRLSGLGEVTLHPAVDAEEEVGAGRRGHQMTAIVYTCVCVCVGGSG